MTIQTSREHDMALARVEEIFDAEPGTPEAAELDALAESIEAYEAREHPIDPPTPQQIMDFRADQERDIA